MKSLNLVDQYIVLETFQVAKPWLTEPIQEHRKRAGGTFQNE